MMNYATRDPGPANRDPVSQNCGLSRESGKTIGHSGNRRGAPFFCWSDMEKTINLKDDPVFRRALEYNDQKNHEGEMIMPFNPAVSDSVAPRADGVKDAIFDLMLAGKLDATDIKIIQARDCSPMPSIREVARILKIDAANVSRRAQRIRCLLIKACAAKN